jgi:cytochrome b6-f complex iron-sulfur subunit
MMSVYYDGKITRKEFLSMLGLGAAAFTAGYCLGGCKSDEPGSFDGPNPVDFTLDLTNPAYNALQTNGGFVYNGGVIVAKTASGSFIAVSQTCTHQGATLAFESAGNRFHCSNHGANFGLDGAVLNGPAEQALRRYNTTLTGNSLRVFS